MYIDSNTLVQIFVKELQMYRDFHHIKKMNVVTLILNTFFFFKQTGFIWICYSYEETKEELEEFQISSRELEQELETQLKQEEKKKKELLLVNERQQNECDSLRVSSEWRVWCSCPCFSGS